MIKRGELLVGPPFERRPVEELTREELIDEMYRAYEQQERHLSEIKRRGKGMQDLMHSCSALFPGRGR